jgi:hypothetical protein
MTDDRLFGEYSEKLQRRALADYGVWIELGVVRHTVEGAGKMVRFDAARARCHGGVGIQVNEALARLCNGMVTSSGPAVGR